MDIADRPELIKAQERLGLSFRDTALLGEALVHRSCLNENPDADLPDNERLEFLGDALLGLVVADALYQRFPDLDEGRLTQQRAALVRRDTLARVAADLGLGEALLLGVGEEQAGGRVRPSNLAAAFEAVAGALYQDQGYAAAREFALRAMAPEIRRLEEEGLSRDPKSLLQETVQARGQAPPVYRTLAEDGPGHARTFLVEVLVDEQPLGQGRGDSKTAAQREAARQALERLSPRGESPS